ncbi:hypothetical protein, partial [Anaerosolibacter sp.]|uniref:hypothetical protein n=1 Tax=Anaerosolibacter sp. TaxID=1872527 RepID=UPI0039EE29D8
MTKLKRVLYVISILIIIFLLSNLIYSSIFTVDAFGALNHAKDINITKENIREIYMVQGIPKGSENNAKFKVKSYKFQGDAKLSLVNLINDNYKFQRIFYSPQNYQKTFSVKFVLDNDQIVEFLIALSKRHIRITNLTEKNTLSKVYKIKKK